MQIVGMQIFQIETIHTAYFWGMYMLTEGSVCGW